MGVCICFLLHLECHLSYVHEIWGSLTRAFKTGYSPQIGCFVAFYLCYFYKLI